MPIRGALIRWSYNEYSGDGLYGTGLDFRSENPMYDAYYKG